MQIACENITMDSNKSYRITESRKKKKKKTSTILIRWSYVIVNPNRICL